MSTLDRVKQAIRAKLGTFFSSEKLEEVAQAALDATYEPADADETAKPWPYEDGTRGPPKPDPEGRFLLIMHDEHQQGYLWMRRYRDKNDALCIVANYTGKDQVWLYEIGAELDLGREIEDFWPAIQTED